MNKIDGIEISNPDKILYPQQKIKKIDVINYYSNVASLMLPHVKNRLLSVIRCHENINAECFFKKHPTSKNENVHLYTPDKDKDPYFYITDKTQLILQVQFGTVEFHVSASEVKAINKPNVMIFDLDPDEKMPISVLRDAVKKFKSVIDELGLKSYLKTSGGKGYHIVIPFSSCKSYDNFYNFSRQVALLAESKFGVFTTDIRKNRRKGKIFIDYLRNNRGSTCVAPYSLRARNGATVALPVDWADIDRITPNAVTLKNYEKYLSDAWNGFFDVKQTLN